MSALAPTLQAFFSERLINEKGASPHTIAAYRDTFRLLLCFAQQHTGKPPSSLEIEDLDAPLIAAFLDHLEHDRNNSPRTRNARLAAIHSMFRFAALRHPEHAALIARVLAVPTKRFDRAVVSYLTAEEVDALLAAPDRSRWIGRRDHALLTVAIQTGLRVSELTSLRCQDVHLGTGAHVQTVGKGRRMKNKGLGFRFARTLRRSRPADRSRTLLPGRQIGSCGFVSARAWVDRPDAQSFRSCGIAAGAHAGLQEEPVCGIVRVGASR